MLGEKEWERGKKAIKYLSKLFSWKLWQSKTWREPCISWPMLPRGPTWYSVPSCSLGFSQPGHFPFPPMQLLPASWLSELTLFPCPCLFPLPTLTLTWLTSTYSSGLSPTDFSHILDFFECLLCIRQGVSEKTVLNYPNWVRFPTLNAHCHDWHTYNWN